MCISIYIYIYIEQTESSKEWLRPITDAVGADMTPGAAALVAEAAEAGATALGALLTTEAWFGAESAEAESGLGPASPSRREGTRRATSRAWASNTVFEAAIDQSTEIRRNM